MNELLQTAIELENIARELRSVVNARTRDNLAYAFITYTYATSGKRMTLEDARRMVDDSVVSTIRARLLTQVSRLQSLC